MLGLEELLEQIKILNEHLANIKKMIAPILGYRVKEELPCKKIAKEIMTDEIGVTHETVNGEIVEEEH